MKIDELVGELVLLGWSVAFTEDDWLQLADSNKELNPAESIQLMDILSKHTGIDKALITTALTTGPVDGVYWFILKIYSLSVLVAFFIITV